MGAPNKEDIDDDIREALTSRDPEQRFYLLADKSDKYDKDPGKWLSRLKYFYNRKIDGTSKYKYRNNLKPDEWKKVFLWAIKYAMIVEPELGKAIIGKAAEYGLTETELRRELELLQEKMELLRRGTAARLIGTKAIGGSLGGVGDRTKEQQLYIAYINSDIKLADIPDQKHLQYNLDVAARIDNFHSFYYSLIALSDIQNQIDLLNQRLDKLIEELSKKEESNLLWECMIAMLVPGFVVGLLAKIVSSPLAKRVMQGLTETRKINLATIEDGIKDGLKTPARLVWSNLRQYFSGNRQAMIKSLLYKPRDIRMMELIESIIWIPILDLKANITIGAFSNDIVKQIDNHYINLNTIVKSNSGVLKVFWTNEFSKWLLQVHLINVNLVLYDVDMNMNIVPEPDFNIIEPFFPLSKLVNLLSKLHQITLGTWPWGQDRVARFGNSRERSLKMAFEALYSTNGLDDEWAPLEYVRNFLFPSKAEYQSLRSSSGSEVTTWSLRLVFGSTINYGDLIFMESVIAFGKQGVSVKKYWKICFTTPLIGQSVLRKASLGGEGYVGEVSVNDIYNFRSLGQEKQISQEYYDLYNKMVIPAIQSARSPHQK